MPPSRRVFLQNMLLAAAGSAALPSFRLRGAEADEAAGLRALDAATTPLERVRIIERYVHRHHYDPAGLMYSHTDWEEERAFVPSDFSPRDSTMSGPEASEWLNYENSPMIAGLFLAAQCYRYRATRDPEALAYARQAFHALEVDYRLTGQGTAGAGLVQKAGIIELAGQPRSPGSGWFCKPYGGIPTGQTSTEQNFLPAWSLYLYHAIAPEEVRPRIAQMLREISQHWRRGYVINYFGSIWDMETSYPRAPRHMISWAAVHRMAYEITQDPGAYDEYNRLDALFGYMPTPLETLKGLGEPSYVSTEDRAFHLQVVIAGEVLAELEPARGERYRRGLAKWWRFSHIAQREDLSSYYFIKVDTTTGAWEKLPASVKPRALWTNSFMLENGIWPICWLANHERQGITSAIVARWGSEEAQPARQRWTRIYGELKKQDLHWFIDPEHSLPPELTWMTRVMEGDALALYPLGYWYAQAHRLNLT